MGELQRRLDLIILAHLWVLAPLALLWFLVPAWRSPDAPTEIRALGILAGIIASYLVARTWLTVRGRAPNLNHAWPYLDVLFVSSALVLLRSPTDPLSILYLIPLASAVASLSVPHLAGVAIFTVAGYLAVVVYSAVPWSIGLLFRLVIVAVLASLYGWLIRTVTVFERAAERAEFQTELAREIHDGIQHLLVTMGARLELARRLVAETPDRASAMIAEEREMTRRAADELRYLVRRLRSAASAVDLASALRLQVTGMADRWPFALNVDMPPQLPRLNPAAEHAVLRVIQESLTNVAKHAHATEVTVQLTTDDRAVVCTIRDNGRGFDPSAARSDGLSGLYDRIRAAGGTLEIHAAPGQGTTIQAAFPLPEAQRWRRSAS